MNRATPWDYEDTTLCFRILSLNLETQHFSSEA